MLGESGRRELARYGAAAAFLLAVTVALLLVRAGIRGASHHRHSKAKHTVASTIRDLPEAPVRHVYYKVKPGDTLEGIAIQYRVSVHKLIKLNHGIHPNSLLIGERIRIK